MKSHFGEQPVQPSTEQLAAYADGELDDACREAVERWLKSHPDDAAEIKGQRDLLRLWQRDAAPEPSAAAWNHTLSRIHAAVADSQGNRRRIAGVAWVAAVLGTAAAACLLWALWPSSPPSEPGPRAPEPIIAEEPFPVVASDEVAILTIDDDDVNLLIVGVPPLRDPIELATKGQIVVDKVEPADDGVLPKMWTPSDAPAAKEP